MTNSGTASDTPQFLTGGGEMGERIRAFDWSKTAIGPIEGWSPALRMQVSFLLANRFPMLLWWGPAFSSIYNDAYAPILGTKHPWALGRPVSECWSEIWDVLKPLIETPFNGGPPTWIEDFQLEIHRHGYLEEGHFTVAYSPVPDETAPRGIGGVVATVHEISGTVFGERRVAALRDLGSRAGEAKTAEQACAIATATLAAHGKDLPFVLLYLIDDAGERANLAGAAGVAMGEDISPQSVELGPSQVAASNSPRRAGGWPLGEAWRNEDTLVVEKLGERFSTVPQGPWSDPPHTAVVMPIPSHKAHEPAGLLVAGVSSRLKLDDHYRDFFELLRSQLATAIANARAYEEEKKRAEALAELDRAKTAFFSNVSHEFRTPLTLMLGPVEDLLGRSHTDLTPAAKSQLEVVNRNGLRLLRLVNTLLDFSRIEAGRIRAVYQPTELANFTTDLVSNFRSACDRAGIALAIECSTLSQTAYVDREMWEKIVLNLLSNAFKFTTSGGIFVTLREVGTNAELTVRDTGVGISAVELPRIFERFHRVENAQGRTHEGSGIGLALVQELVKLHGGTITAQSVVGKGTTFTVTVPLGSTHLPPDQISESRALVSTGTGASPYVEEALRWLPDDVRQDDDSFSELPTHYEAVPVPALPSKKDPADDRPRVLVADDNADMRQYVVRLLAERYQIEAVADGEAALAAAREQPPQLVLTDVMMPRLDGFGLLRELRADPHTRDIPVIMLSARAGEESRVEGMEAGADDYLIKPFSARELLARVGAHLQMARMRREAGAALRESEARFRHMADNAPVMVWVSEPDGTCSYLSKSWCDFTGQSLASGLGFGWVDAVHPDDRSYVRDTFLAANARREAFRLEYRLRRKDGQYCWAIDTAAPRIAADGTMLGYIGSVIDITERKRVEEALRQADRRKDEFLATLAHELRNPLAPIVSAIELLHRVGDPSPAATEARATLHRQITHMTRLVDDLLDVSRITQDKLPLRKELVELGSVIRAATESCGPLVEGLKHELTVSLPPEPIYLEADPTRLAQVFGNLFNNACKYTEPRGHVWLSAERHDNEVVVKVRDSGIGIPVDKLEQVFDMFSQVGRTLERQHGGLGIGLHLVKRLVELHGGTVTAHSDGEECGSEFVVRLPALAAPHDDQPLPKHAVGQTTARRILVVDDNRDAAKTMAYLLKHSGHETELAYDGEEAVEKAEAYRPDLILLDIGLPKMNGYDVCREIRSQPWAKNVVIVALTGWGQEDDRRKSESAGFSGHLIKPVDYGVLRRLLDESQTANA